jgi:hypothetical protein
MREFTFIYPKAEGCAVNLRVLTLCEVHFQLLDMVLSQAFGPILLLAMQQPFFGHEPFAA